MVRTAGLEPALPVGKQILSPFEVHSRSIHRLLHRKISAPFSGCYTSGTFHEFLCNSLRDYTGIAAFTYPKPVSLATMGIARRGDGKRSAGFRKQTFAFGQLLTDRFRMRSPRKQPMFTVDR